jgi:ferric hydroxamate transport system permease protein
MTGWHWVPTDGMDAMLHWRGPRVFAALAAGALLGGAGAIMQRVTGNSMASPEVLGISAGASLGMIALLFVVPEAGRLLQIGAAGAGAFVTLLAMLALGRRYGFAPERMLLVGVTLGTAFSALVTVLLAGDDPRMSGLLAWMAGSTYDVTSHDALAACVSLVGLGTVTAFFVRWLDILPLGETVAASLGVNLGASRLALLLLAALMTGVATIVVGPLSFIGLMGPHLARMLGFRRAVAQVTGAALLGAFIMVLADWIGRNVMFPFQIPVGLLATLLGGLYFMWLMLRGRAV